MQRSHVNRALILAAAAASAIAMNNGQAFAVVKSSSTGLSSFTLVKTAEVPINGQFGSANPAFGSANPQDASGNLYDNTGSLTAGHLAAAFRANVNGPTSFTNATTGNTISNLFTDDIHTDPTTTGGNIGSLKFTIAYGGTDNATVRPLLSFYAADGTGTTAQAGIGSHISSPGTIFRVISFNSATLAPPTPGNVNIYTFTGTLGSGVLNLGTGTTIWAGFSADNDNNTTGSGAYEISQIGQGIFNPQVVGTSGAYDYESTADPTSSSSTTTSTAFSSNPAGSFYNTTSGSTSFNYNFGWQFAGPNATQTPSTWQVDGDAGWEDDPSLQNWSTGSYPNGPAASAIFGSIISSPVTVTIADTVQAGTVDFNNNNSYTVAGGTLDFGGGTGAVLTAEKGSHVITSNVQLFADPTVTIAAGAKITATNWNDSGRTLTKNGVGLFVINNSQAGTMTINAGTVQLIAGSAASDISTFTIAGGAAAPVGKLDVTDNDIVFDGGVAVAGIQAYVVAARDGGLWDKNGITTSSAPVVNNVTSVKGLGIISGAEYLSVNSSVTTFDGIPIAAGNTILKFTYNGDADLNGKINANDYGHIDSGFQNQKTAGFVFDWFNGDFDYNGVINANDYALIDSAYQLQSGTLRAALDYVENGTTPSGTISSSLQEVIDHESEFGQAYVNDFIFLNVPEPTTLSIVGLATAGLLARRRRHAEVM